MWQIPDTYASLKPGQSLFIQQWGVETSDRSPLTSFVLRTSITELLREIVELSILVETGQVKSGSLGSLGEEVLYHLKVNRLLDHDFPEDVELLREIFTRNTNSNDFQQWKTVRIVAAAFLSKLEAVDLVRSYHQNLRLMLEGGRASYEKIRVATRTLVTELLAKGYSLRYLHQWGYGVFVCDEEPDFLARFDRIQTELGRREEMSFDCVLKFRLPATVDFPLTPFEITDESILDERCERDPEDRESCKEFFRSGLSFVKISLRAMDRHAAAEKAHKMLADQLTLWRLVKHDYDPGIPHEVLVIEEDRSQARVIDQVNVSRPLRVGNLGMFIQQQHNCETDARDSIARALHWVRLAAESPRETRLTTLWSALEALVAGRSKPHTMESITESVSAILGLDIMRRRLNYVLQSLEQRLRSKTSTLAKEQVAPALSDLLKGDASDQFKLWSAATESLDELLALHDARDEWFKAEYSWLAAAKDEEKRLVYRFLGEFAESVRMSLFRLYRLRNDLTHQAAVDPQGLDHATSVIGHYLNAILNSLIYAITKNPALSMDELVHCHVWTFEQLQKKLRSESLTGLDLKDVISPRLRLCN